jgi:type I restriction enzyme, R subunit
MNQFSEDNLVEQTTIKLIKQIWNDESCHINAFKDEDDTRLGRDHRGEVVLKKHLLPALKKINPSIPEDALQQAVSEITRDRSNTTLVKANQEIYKLLKDGFSVNIKTDDGGSRTENVKYFDFGNPDYNSFLCVSQFWVVGEMHTRRPDVVLFVNGIPLLLLELKASHKSLVDAYRDNIRDYKDTIPQLFWYNCGIIISNGIENKFGSLTSPFEYFNEWKKVESEDDSPKTDLTTIIFGICDKKRLLDIFENFIIFDESLGLVKKIVPRYFQYYGVNRAFDRVVSRRELDGKLGVFWHTQGSGKSFAMVYLSQKVFRKIAGNFTFIVVTDREQLDGQAYKNFANVGAVYEKHVRADSIKDLRQLLGEDHRQIFTTIQKFQDISGPVSSRDDIIVMTDEAHRSQYDTYAQNMRKALPNASFIGFTGTPLLAHGEEKTRSTFGEYVSVYNFGQSVKDGATVRLFYENRVAKLEIVNPELEKDLSEIMDYYDLNDDEEEKVEQEFSTAYHLITREDRLNAIARDIVQHFIGRGYDGKAMVVSIDKKTAVRMYIKVKTEWERHLDKLRLDLSRTQDEYQQGKIQEEIEKLEKVDMAVVVSQSQNEIADLEPFDIDMRKIRGRIQNENLEEEFRKDDSNLKIAFVCAMWLTGFDVPTLSTLYLDKPLKNHTLMQTIARANRVAEGKTNGIIVDYIGVFKNVEKALALYASTKMEDDEIIKNKDELIDELVSNLNKMKEFLKKYSIELTILLHAPNEQKLLLIEKYANTLLENSQTKKDFLNLSADLYAAYQAVLPDPGAEDYYQEVTAARVIASRVRDIGLQSFDTSPVKRDLEKLLDKSIQAGEYVIPQYKRLKDLSILDADALHDFFYKLENKNLQVEALKDEIEKKITEMMKRNNMRGKFMERFTKLLEMYNSGAHDIDQLFDDLVGLAKELSEEEQRAVKENLNEEELAIFDLLLKEKLNPDEREKVKKTAKELLAKLKQEKLVIDWREKEIARAGVKTTISKVLYDSLPEPTYSEKDCEHKGVQIYNFVYEHYHDAQNFVYA